MNGTCSKYARIELDNCTGRRLAVIKKHAWFQLKIFMTFFLSLLFAIIVFLMSRRTLKARRWATHDFMRHSSHKSFVCRQETRLVIVCIISLHVEETKYFFWQTLDIISLRSEWACRRKNVVLYGRFNRLFCLFICFESHEQFFSYLATHHYRWQGCKFRPMLSAYGF
jgi:hypothetical protein